MPGPGTDSPPFVVALEGVSNLRDLGGYRTADGRTVRRGLMFRSAALAGLTEADRAAVAALGLRTVCDFRGVEDRGRAPTVLAGPDIVSVPIEPTVGAGLRDILRTKEATGEALQAVLERAYVAYALGSVAQYRTVLDLVVQGATPLLFHCSAGKDRTGFAAALLLTALVEPWDTVLADFAANNRSGGGTRCSRTTFRRSCGNSCCAPNPPSSMPPSRPPGSATVRSMATLPRHTA